MLVEVNASMTQRKEDNRFKYKGTIYGIMNNSQALTLRRLAGCSFVEGTVMLSMNYTGTQSYKAETRSVCTGCL